MPKQFIIAAAFLAAALGCSSSSEKPWPDLHPTRGTLKVDGQTAGGGYLSLHSDDAALGDYIVSGRVEADGSFKLNTTSVFEKNGTPRPGVPAGTYKARFMPPANGDQAVGTGIDALFGNATLTVKAGDNDLQVTVSKSKKK
jgi:hypothetical protein